MHSKFNLSSSAPKKDLSDKDTNGQDGTSLAPDLEKQGHRRGSVSEGETESINAIQYRTCSWQKVPRELTLPTTPNL